jgi:hypothetical protein
LKDKELNREEIASGRARPKYAPNIIIFKKKTELQSGILLHGSTENKCDRNSPK